MVMLICFQPLSYCQIPVIMGLVCHLLAGEGCGNLHIYCTPFCGNQTLLIYHCLYPWDPTEHLRLVNLCDFRTLDTFKCSWLATDADIWNGLSADSML